MQSFINSEIFSLLQGENSFVSFIYILQLFILTTRGQRFSRKINHGKHSYENSFDFQNRENSNNSLLADLMVRQEARRCL